MRQLKLFRYKQDYACLNTETNPEEWIIYMKTNVFLITINIYNYEKSNFSICNCLNGW